MARTNHDYPSYVIPWRKERSHARTRDSRRDRQTVRAILKVSFDPLLPVRRGTEGRSSY